MCEPETNIINPYTVSVPKLSEGLLENYQKPLEKVQNHLNELTLEQNKIIVEMHNENLALTEQLYSPELHDFVKKLTDYHGKLLNIKKGMKRLHERSNRLKMRALKMEQYTEKMRLKKIQKEINLQKEENLIGPGPSSLSDNAS